MGRPRFELGELAEIVKPETNRWLDENEVRPVLVWRNERKKDDTRFLRDTVETPNLNSQIRFEVRAVLNANNANLRPEDREILLDRFCDFIKNGGEQAQKIFSGLEKGEKINFTQTAFILNRLINDHLTSLLEEVGIKQNDKNAFLIETVRAGVEKATRGANHFGNHFYREGGLDLKAHLESRAAWYEYLYAAIFAELQPAAGEKIKDPEYLQLLDDSIKLALNDLDTLKQEAKESSQAFSERLAVAMKEKALAAAYRYLGEINPQVEIQGKEKTEAKIKEVLGGKDLRRLIASSSFYSKLDPEYQSRLADKVVEKCQFGREIGFDFVMEALRQSYVPLHRLDRAKRILGESITDAFLTCGKMTRGDKDLVEEYFGKYPLSAQNFTRGELEKWIENFAAENMNPISLTDRKDGNHVMEAEGEPILLTERKGGSEILSAKAEEDEEPILLTKLKSPSPLIPTMPAQAAEQPKEDEDLIILGEPTILLTRKAKHPLNENPLSDTDEHLRKQNNSKPVPQNGSVVQKEASGFFAKMASGIKKAATSTMEALRRDW